jgi:regulatory protein
VKPPDHAMLHEAALRHLSRYAATAAGLTRVLDRRIARWAAPSVAAQRLARSGRSRRAVAAHLAARGVDAETAQAAMTGDELVSALVQARRRRIGPFRVTEADADGRRRELGMLARAGFPRDVAERALAMPAAEAEALVARSVR